MAKLKRILILDDDADQRKLLLVYLGKMFEGVDIVEYDPITRGIPGEDFEWSAFDVLILDYYLSIVGVTGLDILQANRKNPDFPAVIMLTGAGNEEIAVRALKAGVYDYLRKQKLNKQTLQDSITNAFTKHQAEKLRQSELTQQGHAFNKAIFYQQLEYEKGIPEYRDRIFFLVELVDHTLIEQHAGIILRDNIVRHIAKKCYELLKQNKANPAITRLGDHFIALLADATESPAALEILLASLTGYLQHRPYKFGNTEFPFSVNIGVVSLAGEGQSADSIIQQAKQACKIAGLEKNNSFHVFSVDDKANDPTEKASELADKATEPGDISLIAKSSPTATKPETAAVAVSVLKAESASAVDIPGKSATATKKELPTADTGQETAASRQPSSVNVTEKKESESELKQAFEEKRVIRVFQPVISLMNDESDADNEIHRVFLQHIGKDGSIKTGTAVTSQIITPDFRKFVDRWLLREIIGKLTNTEKIHFTFILDISDASLSDAGFFTWLRKLLSGLEAKNPGRYLALEINSKDLAKLEKQTNALMTFLRKSHEFKFVLGGISDVREVVDYTSRMQFDLVRCSHKILQALQDMSVSTTEDTSSTQLEVLRLKGTRFITDDVEDASVLTETISLSSEYAMGNFIGEATPQLDDVTNIESFEIV
jgi:CheY-like chemotaxis protein/EAL domain-containing protein (putative c-di-GMP-specific phosphodiesterase class I)